MRCVCCGCDKDAGAFSGAQKKKAVGKRRCVSCTAAAATDDDVDSSSVVARYSSAASGGAAQRALSQGADNMLSITPSTVAFSEAKGLGYVPGNSSVLHDWSPGCSTGVGIGKLHASR